MFEAIMSMFARTQNPYEIGYNAGLEDAIKSINTALPLMLKEATSRLGEAVASHKWEINARRSINYGVGDLLSVDFRIEVRRNYL